LGGAKDGLEKRLSSQKRDKLEPSRIHTRLNLGPAAETYRRVQTDGNRKWQRLCPDDEAAIAKAKRLVNKHGIEIWSGVRLVARLTPETI